MASWKLLVMIPFFASSACSAGVSLLGGHVDKPIEGEGVTGPVHAANVGKIVFSKELIDKASPDSAKLQTSFKDTDRIYARFYLPGPIANHFADQEGGLSKSRASSYSVKLFVDGAPSKDWSDQDTLDPETQKQSTRQVWVNPNEEASAKSQSLENAATWASFLTKLPPGKHTLRFELWTHAGSFNSEKPGAVGEISLERGAGAVKSGYSFAKLKAGMTNPELEREALATIQKHAEEGGWKERFEKVKIQSDAWAIERNERTGIILGRSLTVWALSHWPDGHCEFRTFGLREEHDGSRYSSKMEYASIGSTGPIDCE